MRGKFRVHEFPHCSNLTTPHHQIECVHDVPPHCRSTTPRRQLVSVQYFPRHSRKPFTPAAAPPLPRPRRHATSSNNGTVSHVFGAAATRDVRCLTSQQRRTTCCVRKSSQPLKETKGSDQVRRRGFLTVEMEPTFSRATRRLNGKDEAKSGTETWGDPKHWSLR